MNREDLPDMTDAYNEICRLQEKKKLDPVGKEDGDVDNDGDKDESDKYLMKRRKAIAKAMKNEHHQRDENGNVIENDEEEVEEAYTVTTADKKGNTPAYQAFKAGKKNKLTGKPMYKAADHMKEEEIHPDDNVLSPEELEKVAELSRQWDAKMEEGSSYGLTKGSGKPGGAMKAYLDNKAKKLEADKKKQSAPYKNNPAFGDPSHHSNAKNK